MKKWFVGLALVATLVAGSLVGGSIFADQADHPDPTGITFTA